MSFTALARGRYLEALAIDERIVWFSDVILGGVQGLQPDGSISHWLAERHWIGGILLNEDGSLLCSGPGGIAWFNPTTGRSGTLLSSIDGAPLAGVNEMCPDGRGGLIFGTLDIAAIVKGERPAPVALYRLDIQGKVTLLSDGLAFCNGLAVSSDGTTLYHNESFVGTFAYDIAPDGSLDNRRMLIEKQDCDGMALDIWGNLWITGFSSEELLCLRPDGFIQQRLVLPGGACTNVRFGGPGGRDIFVTMVPLTAGLEIARGNLPSALDSVLYRGPGPLPGRINLRTEFRLGCSERQG
jgi:sugar lactone lactonase YvrE